MPKHPRQQFSDGLSILQQNYLRRIAGYISDIRRLRELIEKDYFPARDLQKMFQITHNLMGSGATFGFPQISLTARELNVTLGAFMESSEDLGITHRRQADVIEKLPPFEQACTEAVSSQTTSRKAKEKKSSLRLVRGGAIEKIVYLVSLTQVLPNEIAAGLTASGFIVKHASAIDEVYTLFETETPDALVLCSDDPAHDLAKLPVLGGARSEQTIPLVVLSGVDNFTSRLSAVRAGAHLYVPPDTDPAEIVAHITAATSDRPGVKPASRILIVDGDETTASFYGHSLQQAGYEIAIARSPETAWDMVAAESANAIVMAISLPDCSGLELAAVIRQLPRFRSFPIVFIVSRDEFEKLPPESRDLNANDFLIKPFSPAQLVSITRRVLDKPAKDG